MAQTSRKLYRSVARVLDFRIAAESKALRPMAVAALERIATELADIFQEDNPRFNRERFLLACNVRDT